MLCHAWKEMFTTAHGSEFITQSDLGCLILFLFGIHKQRGIKILLYVRLEFIQFTYTNRRECRLTSDSVLSADSRCKFATFSILLVSQNRICPYVLLLFWVNGYIHVHAVTYGYVSIVCRLSTHFKEDLFNCSSAPMFNQQLFKFKLTIRMGKKSWFKWLWKWNDCWA